MKKTCVIACISLMASCSSSEKETTTETPKAKMVWVCDSVTETYVDSTGKEVVNTTRVCDSILQQP